MVLKRVNLNDEVQVEECGMVEAFKLFKEEWDGHKEKANEAMARIESMHENMASLVGHASHLSKLDTISRHLESMNDNLVGPATSENKISLKAHMLSLCIAGGFILILAIFVLWLLTERSDRKINIGGESGISIEGTNR
jgi:hypothetical protein